LSVCQSDADRPEPIELDEDMKRQLLESILLGIDDDGEEEAEATRSMALEALRELEANAAVGGAADDADGGMDADGSRGVGVPANSDQMDGCAGDASSGSRGGASSSGGTLDGLGGGSAAAGSASEESDHRDDGDADEGEAAAAVDWWHREAAAAATVEASWDWARIIRWVGQPCCQKLIPAMNGMIRLFGINNRMFAPYLMNRARRMRVMWPPAVKGVASRSFCPLNVCRTQQCLHESRCYVQLVDPVHLSIRPELLTLWLGLSIALPCRVPRRKTRHVIIDVCCRMEDAPDGTQRGALVQQVVSKGDRRMLGPAGYRIARKARWGDLWPKFIQDCINAR
jgi:hypothetical protein